MNHHVMKLGLLAGLMTTACITPAEQEEAAAEAAAEMETEEAVVSPSPAFYGDPAANAVFSIDISHWEGPMAQVEMDCFWSSGVRHVVSGTQVEEITRQQLDMAISRGMTVDAYVYLYWDRPMAAQVREAFRRVQGFPIGRMWLDVEENPGDLGWRALEELVQQAVDACDAEGTAECGIYTGPGFWRTYMNNTTRFAELPLWYAWYNDKTALSNWSTERFGGWVAPEAKQWAEEALCSVGVDKNSMRVVTTPSVVVDRSTPPAPQSVPPAPTNLLPADGSVVSVDYVKLMAGTVAHATSYQLALEHWNGTSWVSYYTWTRTLPFIKSNPIYRDRVFRFRARAKNRYGWGAWSGWVVFDYGTPTGPRPDVMPAPEPEPAPGSAPAPSPSGAPTGLAPDGVALSTSSVTLSCNAQSDATRYEFAIEYQSAGSWQTYTSYLRTSPTATFWPQIHNTAYRWRVRSQAGGTYGAWSNWAQFDYR
ncbi:MAG: GH25 family lysozyme [Myxococcota bacterium]